MKTSTDYSLLFKRVSYYLGLIVLSYSSAVLAGWLFNISALISIIPNEAVIKVNSSVCFMIIGAALLLINSKKLPPRLNIILIGIMAYFILAIGLVTICEYSFGWNAGIDQLLISKSQTALFHNYPGRISLNSSINFVLIALALLMIRSKNQKLVYGAQIAALAAGVISLVALIGHVYNAQPLIIGAKFSTAMSLYSMALFLVVCASVFFARPGVGFMSIITSGTSAGRMARAILPAAIVIPLAIGWFKLAFQRHGLISIEIGAVFVALSNMIAASVYVYILAAMVDKKERDLKASEERYRLLIDNADEAVVVAQDGVLKFVNPKTVEYTGISKEGLLSKPFTDIIYPDDRAMIAERHLIRLEGGKLPNAYSFRVINGQGDIKLVEIRSVVITWEGRPATLNFLSDVTERKKAEAELIDSEEQFRSLFDNMSEGVALHEIVYDGGKPVNYRIIDVNKSYESIIGVSREQITGKLATEAYGTTTPPYFEEYLKVSSGKKPYSFEVYFPPMDKHFAISVAPWKENGFATLFTDITERKKAENALRESEEKFKNLFNNSEVGMFRTAFDGSKILDMNEKFLSIYGYTKSEMREKPSSAHWANPGERAEMVKILLRDGVVKEFECDMLTKSGEVRKCITSLRLLREQGILEGSIIDITERKKAEQELRASEEKFRSYIDKAPDGIFVLDNTGRVIEVNSAACRIMGYPEGELVGKHVSDLVAEESAEEGAEHFKKMIETGAATSDIWHKYKDGSKVCMTVDAVRISETKFLGFCKDVTGRKLMEAEREVVYKKLAQSQKMAAVGQLASGVAHEINNPLTVILGFAQLEVGKADKTSSLFNSLKSIERESQRCKKLVSDLLLFAREEKDVSKKADINNVIERALTLIEPIVRSKGCEVIRNFENGLPFVTMNTDRIQQVIINLVSNAADSISNSGTIRVATSLSEKYIHIDVSDNGSGMTEEVKRHLFEPFFSTKKTGQGTGLGLSLCYDIVSKHSGTIDVVSEHGIGTTFSVRLPVNRN